MIAFQVQSGSAWCGPETMLGWQMTLLSLGMDDTEVITGQGPGLERERERERERVGGRERE